MSGQPAAIWEDIAGGLTKIVHCPMLFSFCLLQNTCYFPLLVLKESATIANVLFLPRGARAMEVRGRMK